MLLVSVAGIFGQDALIDDFSCPDELEGYYPHLYRYTLVIPSKLMGLYL